MTELRRSERWGSVFFTLKDPADGACLPASIPRRTFDALKLDIADGERIHVLGRPELFAAKGEFRLRALSLERFGLGAHLAAIERLKQTLADEGLFDAARKRPLPRFPRRIGLVTGSDAAARRDVITTIHTRFPPARDPRRGDPGPGTPGGDGHRRGAAVDQPRAGHRRGHPHPRRRQLRRPAPVQRRERRPRRRRVPGPGRVGGRARAGHAALRPRRRRARVNADGGRQARGAGSRSPAGRADPCRQLARALRAPDDRTRAGRAHAHPLGARARRAQDARSGHAAALPPPRPAAPRSRAPRRAPALDARARGAGSSRHCPRGRRSAGATRSCGRAIGAAGHRAAGTRAPAWTSSWPRAGSAPASRTCGHDVAHVPGAPLAVRRPVEQYGGTGRRLERRERRQPFAEPGSAGRERKAARGVSEFTFESGAAGAGADRRAARARQRRARRGDQALGARRGAAALLPRPSGDRGGQDRGARTASR